MMDKMRDDNDLRGVDHETILKQACFAKNCLLNRHGFSPFQLVFGKAQNPLNTENNYQTCGSNNSLQKFENLRVKARKEFIMAENKIRIEAALKHGQSTTYESLQPEYIMAYFRRGSKSKQGWKGPAKVIGVDNSVVIVRHGQRIIHAHKRDFRKFLKDKGNETAWSEKKVETEKPMMRNGAAHKENQNLIKKTSQSGENPKDIEYQTGLNAHVTMAAHANNENNEKDTTDIDKRQNCKSLVNSKMAKPIEQMAFKADGFPCPQLIVIRADSIHLDDFLQIRHLAMSQRHYITSITDQ